MTAYVALLRGINLMGSTTLRMADLRAIAEELGLKDVRTFIASGNLVFTSRKGEVAIRSELAAAVKQHMSREVGVVIRTAEEMAAVAKANPFRDAPASFTVAIFLDKAPPKGALDDARNVAGERMALGAREIYVHYPQGQGRSRLRIPAADAGTARNMNTVNKLAKMAKELA
jgi:uncharacterized protein (DUF1697 family)